MVQGWIQYGDYSFECGEKLFKRVRNLGLTAVIAASDMTAAGILKAAHQYGYQIPQDLSIISTGHMILVSAVGFLMTFHHFKKEDLK